MEKSKLLRIYEHVPPEIKLFVRMQGVIAERIATILNNLNISQKDFAKKLGMKESQLSNILAGNANLTLKTITRLEVALDEVIIVVPESKKVSKVAAEVQPLRT